MKDYDEKIVDELFDKISPDNKNAFYELEKLAENGNPRAMSNLAQIYLKSFGVVESSYKKAVELFQKAAALNEVYALFRLGEFYRDVTHGFKQDGHIAAEIYHHGKGGVAPDGFKAIELYKRLDEIETLDEVNTCKALFSIADIYTEGAAH